MSDENKKSSILKRAVRAAINPKAAYRGFKANQKAIDLYYGDLPTTIMGREKSKKARDEISSYVKRSDYIGARKYVKSQLQKILEQTKGTGSEGFVKEKLKKGLYQSLN